MHSNPVLRFEYLPNEQIFYAGSSLINKLFKEGDGGYDVMRRRNMCNKLAPTRYQLCSIGVTLAFIL